MTEPTRSDRRGSTRGRTSVVAMTEDDRIAELEARLARLERAPSLRDRSRSMMDRVMPPEASEHFRNAGREHLLGVRSIVDHWIQRIDDADARADRSSHDRETIEIE